MGAFERRRFHFAFQTEEHHVSPEVWCKRWRSPCSQSPPSYQLQWSCASNITPRSNKPPRRGLLPNCGFCLNQLGVNTLVSPQSIHNHSDVCCSHEVMQTPAMATHLGACQGTALEGTAHFPQRYSHPSWRLQL